MEFKTPQPLKLEHDELHDELVRATKAGGRTGDAAKDIARLLHPHFLKEEEYALPPLGLLPLLTGGEVTSEMAEVLRLTEKLREELPQMKEEHNDIVGALEKLADSAKEEGRTEFVRFADKLILHAKTEEMVLYPASILIGEYVKLKLGRR